MTKKKAMKARIERFKENLPTIATGALAATGVFVAAYYGAKNGSEKAMDDNRLTIVLKMKNSERELEDIEKDF